MGQESSFDKKDRRKAMGASAEQVAAQHLVEHGYVILERNWRCRSGEIDLIAEQNGMLIFVEVRSRGTYSASFGTPAESITPRKIKQVRDTAAVYLHRTLRSEASVRFDVVAVWLDGKSNMTSLDHIVAAF